jgi:hypothetical protein
VITHVRSIAAISIVAACCSCEALGQTVDLRGCQSSLECDFGMSCTNETCLLESECTPEGGCADGEICSTESLSQRCLPAAGECTSHQDCAQDGACVSEWGGCSMRWPARETALAEATERAGVKLSIQNSAAKASGLKVTAKLDDAAAAPVPVVVALLGRPPIVEPDSGVVINFDRVAIGYVEVRLSGKSEVVLYDELTFLRADGADEAPAEPSGVLYWAAWAHDDGGLSLVSNIEATIVAPTEGAVVTPGEPCGSSDRCVVVDESKRNGTAIWNGVCLLDQCYRTCASPTVSSTSHPSDCAPGETCSLLPIGVGICNVPS